MVVGAGSCDLVFAVIEGCGGANPGMGTFFA